MIPVILQSVAWKIKQDYQGLDLRRRAVRLPSHQFFQGRGQAELGLLFRSALSLCGWFPRSRDTTKTMSYQTEKRFTYQKDA